MTVLKAVHVASQSFPHFHIPILCLTSHFMCVESFHGMNINVPAGVGAAPLDTQLPSGY